MSITPLAQLAPPGAPPAAPRRGGPLSQRQKAAVIVRLLLAEGAEVALADLPDDLQAALTLQMGRMRNVDRATLAEVVQEFAQELDSLGLVFSGGVSGALTVLDGRISARTAARLRKQAGMPLTGDPWARIGGLAADRLLPILESESTEVAAVLLSKLDVAKAAELLGRLPGPDARRITYAVSQTGAVTPEAVERIGLSLAAQLDAQPESAFDEDPVARVGAILNSSLAATRDEVLTGLEEEDAGFAEAVRRAIFTFSNIPTRIDARDIAKLVRPIEQPVLVTALAAALAGREAPAAEFILENMSKRMADSLRDEIAEAGKIKPRDGEEAMGTVIATVRELEAAGELILLAGDEEEAEG